MSLQEVSNICQAPGCCNAKASGFLLCWDHWRTLPADLRDKAWLARKNATAAHGDALPAAHRKLAQCVGDVMHAIAEKCAGTVKP